MPRERMAPWIAAGVIAAIAIAGVTALVVQAFDDDSSDGQIFSIERDGTKLRLELDLGALGLDEEDLDALEEGDLSLLRALLARIGFADEDLDFEPGGLGALRDLFGDRDGELRGDELGQLLRRLLEERERGPQPQPGPRLDRFRFDGQPVFPDDGGFPFRFDQGLLLGVGLNEQLVVQQVAPGSPADEAGVEVGDAIRSVDGEPVADVAALREAIAAVDPGATYELGIARGDAALTLEVTRPDTLAGAIDGQRLRQLIEALRSGRIALEDVSPQLRPLLEQFALPEPAPRRAVPRS